MSASSYLDGVPAGGARLIAEFATGNGFADLPARELEQAELLEFAASIASASELWREHVAFDDDERHYVCLYRDAHVDVWLLCWTPSNDTGWHDHDVSSGSVAVVQGRLAERILAVGAAGIATQVGAGQVFSFGPDHIHRLTGLDPRSVSVHAYSPPLWRMGQYAVASNGVLRRISVSYAEELRPLDDAGATS
jgi:predicted metal-dependent enzyme (double-stranded beta helix superfamily)